MATPFGALLRDWRNDRGKTQLELSIDAQTTTRHLSFLETGRSRPTEAMVLRLSDALEVPLRDRNRLLAAAGLSPVYENEPLEANRYEPVRGAMADLLAAHEPYPAMVLSDDHMVVAANRGSERMLGGDFTGRNMLDAYLSGETPPIANWEDVAPALAGQTRAALARNPGDERLRAAVDQMEQAIGRETVGRPRTLVACPWFTIGGQVIKTLILAARFDHPLDVTVEELRIELVYPIDDESKAFFEKSPA